MPQCRAEHARERVELREEELPPLLLEPHRRISTRASEGDSGTTHSRRTSRKKIKKNHNAASFAPLLPPEGGRRPRRRAALCGLRALRLVGGGGVQGGKGGLKLESSRGTWPIAARTLYLRKGATSLRPPKLDVLSISRSKRTFERALSPPKQRKRAFMDLVLRELDV